MPQTIIHQIIEYMVADKLKCAQSNNRGLDVQVIHEKVSRAVVSLSWSTVYSDTPFTLACGSCNLSLYRIAVPY